MIYDSSSARCMHQRDISQPTFISTGESLKVFWDKKQEKFVSKEVSAVLQKQWCKECRKVYLTFIREIKK